MDPPLGNTDNEGDDGANTKKAGGGGRGGRKGGSSSSSAEAAEMKEEVEVRVKVKVEGQGQGRGKPPRSIQDVLNNANADVHLHENLLQQVLSRNTVVIRVLFVIKYTVAPHSNVVLCCNIH